MILSNIVINKLKTIIITLNKTKIVFIPNIILYHVHFKFRNASF